MWQSHHRCIRRFLLIGMNAHIVDYLVIQLVIIHLGKGITMSDFYPAVNLVLQHEGGLSENPLDTGGITNFGISFRLLKSLTPEKLRLYGIYDDPVTENTIRELTSSQAQSVYHGEFWSHAPFEKIVQQEICNYVFDMAVNMGIAPAIKCLQRATWAVMKRWEIIKDDGILGEQTIAAIRQCGFLLMPALRAERANHYRRIIETHPKDKEFLNGWFNRTYDF